MPTAFHTVEGHALSSADRGHVAELTNQIRKASDVPKAVRDVLSNVLSPNDAARLVGVSRPLLNQILDEGRIAFFETAGGHRKIKLEAIHAYIEERDEIAAQLAAARAARRSDGDIIADELGLDPETAKRLGIA